MSKQKEFKVPPEGSLSLLANGAQGLRAWRNARKEAENEEKQRYEN